MNFIYKVSDIWRVSNYYRGQVSGDWLVNLIVKTWNLKTQVIRLTHIHIERRSLSYYR